MHDLFYLFWWNISWPNKKYVVPFFHSSKHFDPSHVIFMVIFMYDCFKWAHFMLRTQRVWQSASVQSSLCSTSLTWRTVESRNLQKARAEWNGKQKWKGENNIRLCNFYGLENFVCNLQTNCNRYLFLNLIRLLYTCNIFDFNFSILFFWGPHVDYLKILSTTLNKKVLLLLLLLLLLISIF